MRIEQYFLMTDYSLWEVILNGDSPVPTRFVEGVLQPVASTTAEQRLARKNELKARALPDKHQLKFNFDKDAKTLMEAIEKRFGGNTKTKKIDINDLKEMDLRWQMAMLTMQARRLLQKTGKNLGANGPTSMGFDMYKVECYNCHRKGYFARECRSLNDPRSPGAAEPQRRTSYQAEEEPANFALMAFSPNSSSDNEIGLESVEARLLVYKQNESIFEENIKLLNIEVQLRDTALVTLRHKLEKAEQERDNLKLKLEKFQPSGGYHAVPPLYTGTFMPPKPDLVFNTAPTAVETDYLAFNIQLSPTKPEQDLSHTTRLIAPIIKDWHSHQPIETTIPAATPVPASPKSNSSGKRRNRKACFVCKSVDHLIKYCDYHTKKMDQPTPRNYAYRGHHKQGAPLTRSKP
uniref:Ribonuclease H-like domain-containing protein n=1 Tax=Tanacetum cinerariifolium TaxID=118510 RepID=A0A6L2MMK9_TANCI|nr:ribonuclease H-like domain-containing protein [Tanacetum cinerariifolium]